MLSEDIFFIACQTTKIRYTVREPYMPNTSSAKKALRQSARRKAHNRNKKALLRDTIKNYKKLVSYGKIKEATASLSRVYKTLDKTAKAKTIKKNRASRLKSRLTQLITKSTNASS